MRVFFFYRFNGISFRRDDGASPGQRVMRARGAICFLRGGLLDDGGRGRSQAGGVGGGAGLFRHLDGERAAVRGERNAFADEHQSAVVVHGGKCTARSVFGDADAAAEHGVVICGRCRDDDMDATFFAADWGTAYAKKCGAKMLRGAFSAARDAFGGCGAAAACSARGVLFYEYCINGEHLMK